MKTKQGFLCKLRKGDVIFMRVVVLAESREVAQVLVYNAMKNLPDRDEVTYTLDYINVIS